MFNRYNYAYNNPYKYVDPDGRVGLLTKGIKLIVKGGDVAATIGGAVEDGKTVFSRNATTWQRAKAARSLATEILSPVSARDAKAGYKAVTGGSEAARDTTRRAQGPKDQTLPTERAARREAMRQSGAQVSLPNNYTRTEVYGSDLLPLSRTT